MYYSSWNTLYICTIPPETPFILHLQQLHNDNEGGKFCSRKNHIKYKILFIQFHLEKNRTGILHYCSQNFCSEGFHSNFGVCCQSGLPSTIINFVSGYYKLLLCHFDSAVTLIPVEFTASLLLILLLQLALQPTVGFGLSNNVLPFFPICHQLSPSSHSQHLKIFFCFLFPSIPGSSPSSRPFQFLSEDLFGHPILLHSLSRWPNQLILCPFIHFTIFSPLLISSSSRFVRLFHSLFSYLGPHIHLNIFPSKISTACSSFFVTVHALRLFAFLNVRGRRSDVTIPNLCTCKVQEVTEKNSQKSASLL